MEEMISRWIRETNTELLKARSNQNYFKMKQMIKLEQALQEIRVKLSISL